MPVFWLGLLLPTVLAIGFDGIPGEYCKVRVPTCCPNRNDDCTTPILGNHLCYCDMFCDRKDSNDCCPDFNAVCRGEVSPKPQGAGCIYNDISYKEGEIVKNNCNNCTCVNNDWICDKEKCLIQTDLLNQVRTGRFTWTAQNYTKFWGKKLEEGIRYRLGTLFPEKSVQNMNEILIKPRELPTVFDAREKWPLYIHEIRDQGDCASSWAHSTTAISSDRLSIITEGRIDEILSAQQLLSCNQHRQRGCDGGYLDRAWWYIRKLGVVSEECYPYISGVTRQPEQCRIPKSAYRGITPFDCPGSGADPMVYKMTPPYRISNREHDIMSEIMTNGPVQATFLVRQDFFMYNGGVYQTLPSTIEGIQGYHSVRLIGWGEDNSTGRAVKYWIGANSWGADWGEEGYFRILRGENHCEIESFIIGAWGKGTKRRRRFKMRKLRRRFRKF